MGRMGTLQSALGALSSAWERRQGALRSACELGAGGKPSTLCFFGGGDVPGAEVAAQVPPQQRAA
eukprot:8126277-Pyramimonas_sp.AAC.1